MAPTNAQIVLDAVQAAIDANVPYIHLLAQKHKLKSGLVLRILLTFLPESTDPAAYIPLLRDLNGDGNGLPESLAEASERKSGTKQISPDDAKRTVKTLRLLKLSVEDHIETSPSDSLSQSLVSFLLLKSRRIDAETGALPLVQQLLEPFVEQSTYLKLWLASTILPLLRLNYEFFPTRDEPITLKDFETLRGGAALDTLIRGGIGGSANATDYIRDLKQVVGPWMYGEIFRRRQRKRRPSNTYGETREENIPLLCWGWVNNWLMHIASRHPSTALAIAKSVDWGGPGDVDDGGWIGQDSHIMTWTWGNPQRTESMQFKSTNQSYLKTCLCLLYVANDTSEETLNALEELLLKVAEAAGEAKGEAHADAKYIQTILHEFVREEAGASVLPANFLQSVQNGAHRLQPVELLESNHPLTAPDTTSLSLAAHLLRTARTLFELGQPTQVSKVLHMSLMGTANEQRVLLQRLLQNVEDRKRTDDDCDEIRLQILDITTNPQSSDQAQPWGIFGRVWVEDEAEIDTLIVKAEVNSARYRHVIAHYLDSGTQRLPAEKIEDIVIEVALAAYDNASNGNKTRGGVKKCSDIVAAFRQKFPSSQGLGEIEALVRATHALSFYKLTLQHGVPCVPVNIRVHPQPLSLIEKVLAQNTQSYTQVDNLVSIGNDLVRSGLVKSASTTSHDDASASSDQDALAALTSREITAKAISSALEEGDFDTAYSYITTRLSTHASADSDDILWRAAYAAGKASPAGGTSARQIRRLEQKMELLSQALSFAPPSALTDVLSTWQQCETHLNQALAAETAAEDSWNAQGDSRSVKDRHIPGGFGAEAYIHNAEGTGGREFSARGKTEEAPMGLFDVARAAGSALQKSAFPLKGSGRGQAAQVGVVDDDNGGDLHDDGQRVRKRDMVSNAVTSGLVSGIGWVIGAKPGQQ